MIRLGYDIIRCRLKPCRSKRPYWPLVKRLKAVISREVIK